MSTRSSKLVKNHSENPDVYPQLAGRIRGLFQGPGVTHIRISIEKDGKPRPYLDLYYKHGEPHIVNHGWGWNLAAKDGRAYEWKLGSDEGIVIEASDRDLVNYIAYLTDPSWFMASIYFQVMTHPEDFREPIELGEEIRVYQFKDSKSGSCEILVAEDPLWFAGFTFRDPSSDARITLRFSKPESLEVIPAEVLDRTGRIEFQEANESLDRHMMFP